MTAVANVSAQSAQTRSASSGDYVVKSGDTLSQIAADHGVSLDALIRANPQISNPHLIRPGQEVSIPAGGSAGAGGGGAPQTYTVRSGDTLSEIGERFGVDWRILAQSNGLDNPNLIRPGQQLNISGGGGQGGATGGVDGPGGAAPAGGGSGRNAAEVARQYLGRNASDLKVDRSDNLPMNPNVANNVCCANFVSAVLTESGQLPANLHTDRVETLDNTLRSRGWTEVSAAEARPGDVVIIQGGGVSHTVLVNGPGQTIGSNNRNADGSQRVTTGSLDWAMQHGGKILRAPASATGGTEGAGGTNRTGGTEAPTAASGTEAGRINQAMDYFVGQGWSRAQAAGIVANLQRESGLRTGAVGDGGQAYGIAQWHPDRQANFARFAGHSIRESTFGEQLAFVQYELTRGAERSAGNRLRGADSASEAGSIVSQYYERPADRAGEASLRGAAAQRILNGYN